jgi:hypothetical protein
MGHRALVETVAQEMGEAWAEQEREEGHGAGWG